MTPRSAAWTSSMRSTVAMEIGQPVDLMHAATACTDTVHAHLSSGAAVWWLCYCMSFHPALHTTHLTSFSCRVGTMSSCNLIVIQQLNCDIVSYTIPDDTMLLTMHYAMACCDTLYHDKVGCLDDNTRNMYIGITYQHYAVHHTHVPLYV